MVMRATLCLFVHSGSPSVQSRRGGDRRCVEGLHGSVAMRGSQLRERSGARGVLAAGAVVLHLSFAARR